MHEGVSGDMKWFDVFVYLFCVVLQNRTLNDGMFNLHDNAVVSLLFLFWRVDNFFKIKRTLLLSLLLFL